ncbi:MAG: glucokinase [Gemmatimonadota bacterium]|nr:glucokinase [Gemmatimonadota bacterium]
MLLAGDVGGTKTVLALVDPASGRIAAEATFESRALPGLDGGLGEFLDRNGATARWASLSVAGPVIDGRAHLSNLGWTIDGEELADTFGLAAVRLVNDLQATAFALPQLGSEHLLTLQAGEWLAGGARAVIAPGTGLGEAFIFSTGPGFTAYPSEGGNADFAPTDRLQAELCLFLLERQGHVSYEDVCSGRGIPNIYRFLKESGTAEEPAWLRDRLAVAADAAPVIVEAALADPTPGSIAALTLDTFAAILAAEAGNLALRVLATGGVYLGGGIPPKVLPALRSERFLERFRAKGIFAELLGRMPLHVILEPRAALLGAATSGLDLVSRAPSGASSRSA